MANGERWQDYFYSNDTIACPPELPFGTRIMIENNIYTCRDRGGKIQVVNGVYWVDILASKVKWYYGEQITGYLVN